MKYKEIIQQTLSDSAALKTLIAEQCMADIGEAALLMAGVFRKGGMALLCGNGGSAGDAQHIATELVVRLSARMDRDALPAMALTTNSSTLTACGNDYGFDRIFSRQVEAFGAKNGLFVGISTSGNSANVQRALEAAQKKSMASISLLGGNGGSMKGIADVDILVPHTDTARIQEGHITIGHILCDIVERELYAKT